MGRLSAWRRTKPFLRDVWKLLAVALCFTVLFVSLLIARGTFALPPCPCTVFSASQPSSHPGLYNEPGGIELGMKMRFDHDGYITGIRFYKTPGMGGVHSASLWNFNGTVRMANATFVNESASGWQEVQFAPVAVTANATYTASVFMADGNYTATGNYFTSQINNSPFIIQKDGEAWDGTGSAGQGVFESSSTSVYPRGSFNATNYWIDATYVSSPDATSPTITAQTPVAGGTDIPVTDAITAVFDKRLDPASVSSSTVLITNDQNQPVSGTVSYDAATSTIKFIADELWAVGKTYTVTLRGGGQAIQDFEGHSLTADYSWSFTASATPLVCPCSLQNNQQPVGSTTYRESYANGIELGMKIVPKTNGYITALRFYKPLVSPDNSRAGNIWDAQGNLLATVTTANESDYGWQEATLATPLSVVKDRLYIISFGFAVGDYQASFGKLTAPLTSPGFTAYAANDLRNTALGSGTANSVYTTTAGSYPSNPSTNSPYYYIDAVFSKDSQKQLPLGVVSVEPTNDSYAVKRSAPIRITFDQAINPGSVTPANVHLRDESNQMVPRNVSFDQARRAIVITPVSMLKSSSYYTVTVTPGVTDVRGVSLSADYSWSFTTGAAANAIVSEQGAGGPILVLTDSNDTYGKYYAEILRTEGMPYFDVKDTSQINTSVLKKYVMVLLAQTDLNQSQTDTLESWVRSGGNLVAMRPDKKLAGLFGLKDAGTSVVSQYLRVDASTAAGAGIVSQSMQYKGVADQYTSSDATTVAQLYSGASTPTAHPAVTTRIVGQGSASAFTYDLARSIIALHQGNQSWSAQDRDGDGVRRTNDLFFGARLGDNQPDWLDQTKMAIPQADEQQRLLVNIMTEAMKRRLPAPRFWYLPNDQKAALVLAGDDHNLGDSDGTRQRLNTWLNMSPIGCSVADWECVRASHYVFVNSALTNTQAAQLAGYGFEIADHPSDDQQCGGQTTYTSLYTQFASDLTAWRAKYSSVPNQISSRYHCYAWPDWDLMPRVSQALGVQYDLNTVAYPVGWVDSRSPMVTGSGMNMRLTDTSGAMLAVRQGVTNFDNTAANSTAIAAMLDNAIGVNGYYGIFGSHYDMGSNDLYHDTLVNLAMSRNVPLISAAQASEWLTGREQSVMSELASPVLGQVTFNITASEGAHGLRAMMPLYNDGGQIVSLSYNGESIDYQTKVIKGVTYGVFDARTGEYEVRYSNYVQAASQTGGSEASIPKVHTAIHRTASLSLGDGSIEREEQGQPIRLNNTPTTDGDMGKNTSEAASDESLFTGYMVWLAGFSVALIALGAWWALVLRRRP